MVMGDAVEEAKEENEQERQGEVGVLRRVVSSDPSWKHRRHRLSPSRQRCLSSPSLLLRFSLSLSVVVFLSLCLYRFSLNIVVSHPKLPFFSFADDPFGDPKLVGDPYCTLFVACLSHQTTEHTLRKAMRKYGRLKNLRLVRHIVTGASRGYAFVEFETEREMRRAYKDAHHSIIDDREIIVDYNRQQLMPGWIPRRLGGGLGGKKESGQLRFGGRERPFRAPLRPIPYDNLKRLGIPPPPEGKYMPRHQVPSPPRRERSLEDREEGSHRSRSIDREGHARKGSPFGSRKSTSMNNQEESSDRISLEKGKDYIERTSMERAGHSSISVEREEHQNKRKSMDKEDYFHKRSYKDNKRSYKDNEEKHSRR